MLVQNSSHAYTLGWTEILNKSYIRLIFLK